MQHLKTLSLSLLLLLLAACGGVTKAPELSPASTTATVYKGRATALKAQALVANVTLADTGALPTKGGALQKTLVTASVPKLLSAGVLHAATIGQGNHTRSEASVAGLNLSVAGIGVKASFISSQAAASCSTAGKASVSGSSQLTGLVINGKKITVSGKPNQTISVLGLVKIVINEQTGSVRGATGKKTINTPLTKICGIFGSDVGACHGLSGWRTARQR